jgi:hypothetical protein
MLMTLVAIITVAMGIKLQSSRRSIMRVTIILTLSVLLLPIYACKKHLGAVGITLGQDSCSIKASLTSLREAAIAVNTCTGDKKNRNLENELKELDQEEELDKILLSQLCGEIMEEVMDSGECNEDLLITPNSIPSSKKNSKKSIRHKTDKQ